MLDELEKSAKACNLRLLHVNILERVNSYYRSYIIIIILLLLRQW